MLNSFLQSSEIYICKAKSFLEVTGEDAHAFLQSQFSNDLMKSTAGVGGSVYGLWLDKKGHVLADSHILRKDSDSFLITSEHSEMRFIKEILEKHIIADDVTIKEVPVFGCAVINEQLLNEWFSYFDLKMKLESQVEFLADKFGFVFRNCRLSPFEFEIYFQQASAYENFQLFSRSNKLNQLSDNAMHYRRIERGIPLIPAEIGPNDLAAEGELVPRAASVTKGCYLGQEVVSRLYNLGSPQRRLYIVSVQEASSLMKMPLPQPLLFEGRKLGELKTLYPLEDGTGSCIGVALLKERYIDCFEKGVLCDNHSIHLLRRFSFNA